jgi:tRNA/tmRNA/rRNA uracil-C5-methylase (TrmA/RlmC/RlmD family)
MDLSCLKKNELINLCIELKINLKLSKKNTTKLNKTELKLLIISHKVVKEEEVNEVVKEEVTEEVKEEVKEEVNEVVKEEINEVVKEEINEEVKEEVKEKKINVLDLFCGCGGMSKGLHDAGLNIIAGIDIWDVAINSYKQNFNHLSLCKDLTTFSPENLNNELGKNINIDVIVGGPPCQAYSIAGKRDLLDPRSLLFIEYIKYVKSES